MDCNYARLLLGFMHKKTELDSAEAEALQAHLELCPECEQQANSERDLDEAFGRALLALPVPPAGKARLLNVLAARSKLRLRRHVTAAAIAATLVVAVLGVTWHAVYGPIELSEESVQADVTGAEFVLLGATPEQVEDWFNNQGFPAEAPRNLNYGLLKSVDVARYKKREVPKLVFARDDGGQVAMAEVYVLPQTQFDLASDLRTKLESERGVHIPGSRFDVQIMESPAGGFIFLMIFQGGPLDLFLNRPGA